MQIARRKIIVIRRDKSYAVRVIHFVLLPEISSSGVPPQAPVAVSFLRIENCSYPLRDSEQLGIAV